MKNFIILFAIALCLASCQDSNLERDQPIQVEKNVEINVTVDYDENDEPVLCFESHEEMTSILGKLQQLPNEERESWFENKSNFRSQNDYMWDVVTEIDGAKSVDEVYEIHAKHRDFLIFNDNKESLDIAPYIPSSYGYEILSNKYGNIKIGDNVINYNNIVAFSELYGNNNYVTKSPAIQTITSNLTTVGNYKLFIKFAESVTTRGIVHLGIETFRRNSLGLWNKYSTACYLKIDSVVDNWLYSTITYINAVENFNQYMMLEFDLTLLLFVGYVQWDKTEAYVSISVYNNEIGISNAIGIDLNLVNVRKDPYLGKQENQLY